MNINIAIEDVPVDALPLTVTIDRGYEPEPDIDEGFNPELDSAGGLIPLLVDPKEA